jgi:beta-xylosidase
VNRDAANFAKSIHYPWAPDQGDGSYRNPIIFADYSDPDMIRDGDDFYMIASSFCNTPALPILHSRDLVNWTIINHAVKSLPHPRFGKVQPGCGVWAPSIRKHEGRFWICFPMVDEGIYITTAADPTGQWSTPHLLQEGKGLIDPCPLWDDDGKAYLVHAYARSRAGIKNILRVRPMSPDGSRLLGEGQIIYDDPARQPTLEGPKFLKRDGYYYILAPAGGVGTGWQLVLRSRNIYGPYEEKKVLEQGSTPVNGPHQGALEQLPSGQWWFVHFQEAKPYGRIIHLQPVTWKDGWPLMGVDHDNNGIGEPVGHFAKPQVARACSAAIPQTSDEFDSPELGLQWQWQANHEDRWYSLTGRRGWLRLFSQPLEGGNLTEAPSILTQKFPARAFSVQTRLEFSATGEGEMAGLVVLGVEYGALALRRAGREIELISILLDRQTVLSRAVNGLIDLRVDVADGGKCTFSFAPAGGPFQASFDFTAREGVWIGATVGLFSLAGGSASAGGYADFDYFRFAPPASSA